MGALTAVLQKKGEDAEKAALAMLKTMKGMNIEAYGIGSAATIEIKRALDQFQNSKTESSITIGYAFSRILERDKPQPLRLQEATMIFDGRIFPTDELNCDSEVFALKLPKNREESAKTFIKQTEGDFTFAVAEPERLIAGRDSLGLRPLFYGENNVFAGLASERKALWKIGIEHVESFPPGHVALIDKRGFKLTPAKTVAHSEPKKVTMETASRRLRTLLERAVSERVAGLKEVAVAFSGGLDSSILAFLANKSGVAVELVHASMKNQPETEHAKKMADELKLPIHSVSLTEDNVLEALPTVLSLIEEPDPVKASIGIPFYWAAEKTAEMNIRVMLAGQGADELFAGYRRYVDDYIRKGREKAEETIFKDIAEMHENNFERDMKICNFHGVEMRLPFATYDVARFAVNLPIELKIQPTEATLRKLVLRNLASNLGLPLLIVERPKKAVQYSTGVSQSLKKAARRKHQTLKQYVQEKFQAALKNMMQTE
ncbi:MAG TPA: asparagine synthetase B [Candidatus Acidoferrales bacterium]|nr:asparagine synthetase B [Candidatus Acidoferrales bacterium]